MEARYAFRKTPWLDACQVAPEICAQVIPRLYTCMAPCVTTFQGQVAAASRCGQSRLPLQGFIGGDAWDDAPLREEVRGQVKRHVGQGDGVLVCDPSGCPTSGRESVGVARQWCGRLGTVDHCPVALYLGSVSRKGHSLVDTRLSLPTEWTKEKARLDKAGVPHASRASRTRHQLALEERALLAVPSHTAIRDLETPLPAATAVCAGAYRTAGSVETCCTMSLSRIDCLPSCRERGPSTA